MIKEKINWLSVLQGWGILLVVAGHVGLSNISSDPDFRVASMVDKVIYSFHMPMFMFISGYLCWLTKINRSQKYLDTIKDRCKRLCIPYLFFTLITTALKLPFSSLMRRPVELSFSGFIDYFLRPSTNPLQELWFLATLLVIFLFYPFFKWSLQKPVYSCFTVFLFFVLNHYSDFFPTLFAMDEVALHLVFFYAGILFARYQWAARFEQHWIGGLSALLYLFLFLGVPIPVLQAFCGIFLSIYLCRTAAKRYPRLFLSFRNYTFQIYLMAIFFQMVVRFVFAKFSCQELYLPFYVLSIFCGIYLSVLVSKLLERIGFRPLLRCIGL